jgi:trimeric autotransporter adhesin
MLSSFLNRGHVFLALFILLVVCADSARAQSTGFTYQGRLNDNSQVANGNYDFEFKLFTALTGGTQDGTPREVLNVAVSNGVFTVLVDFGAGAFPGADRFLEIGVRPAGGGAFTTLTPRQQVTITPYAIKSASADQASFATNANNAQNAVNATDATQLGGVAANQYVLTNDSRLSDARNPLPNSPNYIGNSTTQQASSNFNISGNGTAAGTLTANIVSATTQYNIGLARVLSSPGSFNFFAGNAAGQLTTGASNSFFGVNAGIFNTTGSSNAFFGFEAGRNNNIGQNNSYFGKDAGRSSTSGNDNAFFGNDAGQSNTTGASNAFFGKGAGADNSTATGNSFFGFNAGNSNTTGAGNAFFGFESGRLNDDGVNNSFFGYEAGESNVVGLNNSFFGFNAGKLNTGSRNSYFGSGAGQVTAAGLHNSFFGGQAGGGNTTGDDNTFVGLDSGITNTTGSSNTALGSTANVGSGNLTNATAIGAKASVTASNALVLGQINGTNGANANTNVGIGTTAPLDRLHVNGIIRVITLGAAGSTTLCQNASNQIATCSSSLRYKADIKPFWPGLNLARRLQPITFKWKDGGTRDLGLGAEDVERVEPLLVTYNQKGEVEGVKYDRVAVVLLNAVNEQQAQIEKQHAENNSLKAQLEVQRKQLLSLQARIDELVEAFRKRVYRESNTRPNR